MSKAIESAETAFEATKTIFRIEPPKTLMKRKKAGQDSLGIDMEKIRAAGIAMTLHEFNGEKEGKKETLPFVDCVKYLISEEFECDQKSGVITLKNGKKFEGVSLTGTGVPFHDLFFKVWNACKKPLWDVNWFYIEHDEIMDEPTESWSFFIADGYNIVLENCSIIYYQYRKDSSIWDFCYEPIDGNPWRKAELWDKAYVEYMYRKYYTETRSGQLAVLALGFGPDGIPTKYGTEQQKLLGELRWVKRALFVLTGAILYVLFARK